MGLLALFGNLIPYYYYWSGVLVGTMPAPGVMPMGELFALIFDRVLLDKPAHFAPVLVVLPLLYGVTLVAILIVAWRMLPRFAPAQTQPKL